MSKVMDLGVFVGGAVAGSFVASYADELKNNLSMLFIPPPVQDDEPDECDNLVGDDEDEYEDD